MRRHSLDPSWVVDDDVQPPWTAERFKGSVRASTLQESKPVGQQVDIINQTYLFLGCRPIETIDGVVLPIKPQNQADARGIPLSVVIATRDRGDTVVAAVQSLLKNTCDPYEIIVVDQSDDDLTARALRPFVDEKQVRYIKTAGQGVSQGRNLGIQQARGELIGILDDDCEVAEDWLHQLALAFSTNPRPGVVFGNVLPGPHDPKSGFIPLYVRTEPFLARGIEDKHQVEGLSACMGLRRTVWQELHGFDEMLGAGAPLKSGSESDYTIRALLAGYAVYETPVLSVTHHGFRTWDEGRRLIFRYWYGTGAMLAKHLKCGHGSIVQLLLRLAWRWLFDRSKVATSFGEHSYRLRRLLAFGRGFARGLVTPVDRTQGLFASQAA